MAVESSPRSLTEGPILHPEREHAAHRVDDRALALPGLTLDVVRAPPWRSFGTEATGRAVTRPGNEDVPAGFTGTLPDVSVALTPASGTESLREVLGRWRAAERALETLDAASPEREATIADIAELRARYQHLFEARLREA